VTGYYLVSSVDAIVSNTEKNWGEVLQANISQRVVGIWFIWFLRSVPFIRFDERERQARPALPSHKAPTSSLRGEKYGDILNFAARGGPAPSSPTPTHSHSKGPGRS
jgi:hypothetical protein